MLTWKEAARHYRYMLGLSRRLEIDLKVRLGKEHEKRVALVMTLFEILPKIAHVDRDVSDGWWCRVCQTHNDHASNCLYIAAMHAVVEAGRSPE